MGVFAEAVRNPTLFGQMRRLIDTEITLNHQRLEGRISAQDAGCILAFVIGSLVLGAFAPRKTVGFGAPGLRRLVAAMRQRVSAT